MSAMRGGCRDFGLFSIFCVSLLLACGGDRGTDTAPAGREQASVPADSAVPDTAAVSAVDTGASAAPRSDITPPPSKPARDVARATPPTEPAAPSRPASPAQKPAAPAAPASDTPLETPSAGEAQTQPNAPLRDQYHQAPLDTLPQQAYDGWKQYNLLCARCHGEDVMGTTIAPHLVVSLKPDGPINTKELFVQTVCAGRPEKGMPAWCPLGLEMDKIEAIYVYVKGRSEGQVHPGRPAVKPEG